MESIGTVVVVVLVIGAIVGFLVWSARKRKVEVATVSAAVAARGWTWAENDNSVFAGLAPMMFGAGRNQRADDVVKGPDFVAYSFRWITGQGDRKDTHTRRVTMVRTPVRLPMMEVVPQNVVTAIETAASGGDLDVELAAFNKAWSVRSTEQSVSHAVLHPRMIERFMDPQMRFRGVFFDAGWIGIVDNVVPTATLADHAESTVAVAREIEALLPPHLVREYGTS
jgi:hypothetical protein